MSRTLNSSWRKEIKDIHSEQEGTPYRRDEELGLEWDMEEDRILMATVERDTPSRQEIQLDQ